MRTSPATYAYARARQADPLNARRREPARTFPRLLEMPFDVCLDAFGEWWRRSAAGGMLLAGGGELLGPFELPHGDERSTIAVRMARGRPWSPYAMELQVVSWSRSTTSLELVPRDRVRGTRRYFRDGHELLDAVIAALESTRETMWPPAGSPARWL